MVIPAWAQMSSMAWLKSCSVGSPQTRVEESQTSIGRTIKIVSALNGAATQNSRETKSRVVFGGRCALCPTGRPPKKVKKTGKADRG
jgi:hypothetical protein